MLLLRARVYEPKDRTGDCHFSVVFITTDWMMSLEPSHRQWCLGPQNLEVERRDEFIQSMVIEGGGGAEWCARIHMAAKKKSMRKDAGPG